MRNITPSQFAEILLQSTRLIDVRAPIEFFAGSLPGAVNLPLLEDHERERVGTTYKTYGQDAAISLGHELVSGTVKETRLQRWIHEIEQNPEAILYCFRGGLRSQTTQRWLQERGLSRPLIEGGYKAVRRFLIETLEAKSKSLNFEVVSGPTGSGKTHFLKQSGRPYLDLEALARHRGSAFGMTNQAQPSQVDFENALALALLRLGDQKTPVLIENESRMIGQRVLPESLFLRMKESPKLVLDTSFDQRVENIFQDYVLESALGKRNEVSQFESYKTSVLAISRKLGGARTQELLQDLETARAAFLSGQGLTSNRIWIAKLLNWYYDPLYKRSSRDNK